MMTGAQKGTGTQEGTGTPQDTTEQSDYLSFLLRLWHVGSAESPHRNIKGAVWRAALQDTLTDERLNFASLEDLVAFLWRITGMVSDAGKDVSEPEA